MTVHGPGLRRMQVRAPAKVNLILFVGERTPQDLHELASVMVPIGLWDELDISLIPSAESAVHVDVPGLSGGDTLATRAAESFLTEAQITARVEVQIAKNIPVEAGLGGGSSDAGATLSALNELTGCPLSKQQLLGLAADIGSDVPFFIEPEPAIVRGVGETVVPLAGRCSIPSHVSLVLGCRPLSTASVYSALVSRRPQLPSDSELIELVSRRRWTNDLQTPACKLSPDIAGVLAALETETYGHAMVAGSGSTVFLVPDASSATPDPDVLGKELRLVSEVPIISSR